MKVLSNNHVPPKGRTVWCTHCHSKLLITDADIQRVEGCNAVLCPCCQSHFPTMTDAELTAAYYAK